MNGRGSRRRGFTLVEVLVATAVSLLVAAGAAAVVANALDWEERTSGRQQARTEAARVLDRLAADLETMVPVADPGVSLAASLVDGIGDSGLWEPALNGQPAGTMQVEGVSTNTMRFGIGGVWLRFLADVAGPVAGDGSLPRAVSYRIIRRRVPGRTEPAHLLHRAVVRAGQSDGRPGMWEAGNNLDPAANGPFTVGSAGNDGSIVGDPFSVVRPEAVGTVLAEGVVDLGIRFFEGAADGSWHLTFPTGTPDREFLAPKSDHFPAAAELLVRVLTPAGARRLAALESAGSGPRLATSWWDVVEANSEVSIRWVFFPGRAR